MIKNSKKSIKHKRKKNNNLINKVFYELLKIKGIKKPCCFFGRTNYCRIKSSLNHCYGNMHISTIKWLAQKLDVTPQFIVNIIRRTNKGEEGYNIERFNH